VMKIESICLKISQIQKEEKHKLKSKNAIVIMIIILQGEKNTI